MRIVLAHLCEGSLVLDADLGCRLPRGIALVRGGAQLLRQVQHLLRRVATGLLCAHAVCRAALRRRRQLHASHPAQEGITLRRQPPAAVGIGRRLAGQLFAAAMCVDRYFRGL